MKAVLEITKQEDGRYIAKLTDVNDRWQVGCPNMASAKEAAERAVRLAVIQPWWESQWNSSDATQF